MSRDYDAYDCETDRGFMQDPKRPAGWCSACYQLHEGRKLEALERDRQQSAADMRRKDGSL